jgi:aminoglycoside/choline kinase family phosphotransferase
MTAGNEVAQFLQAAGWGGAKITPLRADFSSRQFARIERSQGQPRRAILMQAAPDQKTPQFIIVADLLRRCGLSAPETYAADAEKGFVLMEDFGDATFGRLLDGGAQPLPLYRRAADVLVRLHRAFDPAWINECHKDAQKAGVIPDDFLFGRASERKKIDPESSLVIQQHNRKLDSGFVPPSQASVGRPGMTHPYYENQFNLPVFNAAMFATQAELFLDSYFPHVHNRAASDEEREAFRKAWLEVLAPLDALPRSLMLRDFMPDNVMNLPEREGLSSTGLLDFQDGGIGPVAYDIASLCECVRRDAPSSLLDDSAAYYHAQNPVMPLSDLRRACYVLSAQRHARVLGILVRLAETQGRKDMLAHISRVRNCLDGSLRQEALKPIKKWVETHMKQ